MTPRTTSENAPENAPENASSVAPSNASSVAPSNASSVALDPALPQGEDKARAVQEMFDTIAPRYDLVNRIMTFRMDVGWRKRTVSALGLVPGSVVADVACGTGDFCHELSAKGFVPVGVDFSFGMLAAAPKPFPRVQADVLALPFADGAIDGITCGFALRNFVTLDGFFDELARAVRPGGRIALVDATTPPNPIMKFGHGIYFGKVVPLIGGLISDKAAYAYLPKSLAYMPEPDEVLAMLRAAGFGDAERRLLSGGIAHLFTGTRNRD
ncbi:MAG: ubiquinone/menaquinone biosynthesis methyltransferase [Microthrixaceae bacterium]|nr:ubiquinone/menaquinone biosynthesis methyltransferase [Microthrixaceae bacterium]HPB44805.1 ubiquinone/menaquinone biosynthesis methyltransferase [Microthrixaceae bacterium]